uniref:Uncharacterized protein n=1 Tax=Sphaerodactylus townsendi TaxID=933632 RepID=A0ACB8GDI9_9SAUR
MSFGFRLFGVVLIFVDILLVIVSLLTDDKNGIFGGISLAIALFFFVDVLLRVCLEGFWNYFTSKLNILDCVIVVGTLFINILYYMSAFSGASKIPRVLNICQEAAYLASEKRQLEKASRRMVSENKRRYLKDGFDLDLTTSHIARVIAMSFPSSGQQSFYRNPMLEVVRFLDTKHENHYKVYNLCSEQGYDPLYFHYRVERIFIDDHNVPTLEMMLKFTANESLDYFGERRTDKSTSSKFQGVETPSQSRYVGYYEILKNKYDLKLPPERPLRIKSIKIMAICGVGKGNGSDLKVQILMKKKVVFQCVCATQEHCKLFFDGERDCAVISLEDCPVICNDVKVRFESTSDFPKSYDDCAFFFWFNTSFIEDNKLYLGRNELDNPHKQKMWKIFREDFAVELNFTEP